MHSPTQFLSQRMGQRNDSLFIYNKCSKFIPALGNFDQPIKVTPSVSKVTPFEGVTLISLDSEYLQKN